MASLNFNMDDMHCAIGRVQIKKMFPIAKKRREVINAIMAKLSDVPVVRLAPMPKGAEPSYWFLRLIFDGSKVNVDKNTFCAAVTAEGIGCNTHYAATPYIGKWYTERIVFGNSGYPWAAPEYKGDKEKRYSLADLPNAAKALDDTIIIYPNESWTEQNIEECALAFRKAYEAYKK
ncbi:UDP-4-amino-4-deoxy-L-arabinose--oxoglutarate aminotransferase [bioreactor metagenome]|uniref:UDP-4-amino-4-deoxy-L-arabinose--oxoglutarate aminotransferase n=1 Tax=bioreactor metagenome TaxID=1076179 RepID=A0A645H3T9_9ZZZZ